MDPRDIEEPRPSVTDGSTGSASADAESASPGGLSTSSASPKPVPSVARDGAARVDRKIVVGGWELDDSPLFRHRVCRSATAPGQGFQTQVVVTSDEPMTVLPLWVLTWLLTGELP